MDSASETDTMARPPRMRADSTPMPTDDPERPPLGSWPLTYALVIVLALLVIALLWWLTVAYDPGAA